MSGTKSKKSSKDARDFEDFETDFEKLKKDAIRKENSKRKYITVQNARLQLDLQAGAPQGHPHIVELSSLPDAEDLLSTAIGGYRGLLAVDAIATVLYMWNPQALSDLLDFKKNEFYWSYNNGSGGGSGFEFYVIRNKRTVRIGSVEIDSRHSNAPDFEVTYRIDNTGCWKIKGGQDTIFMQSRQFGSENKKCNVYDNDFARYLISNEAWKKVLDSQSFEYVVDGKDMCCN